jgi:5-formyltetrahydrofolate cyclo-ligase
MNDKPLKAEIRKQRLAARDLLDPETRIEFSLRAGELAAPLITFQPGTIISGFFPIRSEIDARPLMDVLRSRGAKLCLPIVQDKTTIVFRELVRGAELIDTGFGTCGPGPEAAMLDPEIMIMPLSAFDRQGGRIGYGAGYYDRAIAKLMQQSRKPRLYGFAFSCQEVETVPMESHDQPLDAIITESGVLIPKH